MVGLQTVASCCLQVVSMGEAKKLVDMEEGSLEIGMGI